MGNKLWLISKILEHSGTCLSGQTYFASDEYAALNMFKTEHDSRPGDEFYVVELSPNTIYRCIGLRPDEVLRKENIMATKKKVV